MRYLVLGIAIGLACYGIGRFFSDDGAMAKCQETHSFETCVYSLQR